MALKLKDKPDEDIYDDGQPGWRTNVDGLEDAYRAPSATDEHLPEGHPSRSDKSTPEELNEAEKGGGTPKKDKAVAAETEKLGHDNQIGEGFKPDEPGAVKKLVGRISGLSTRKKVIGGGVIGVGVGGAFFLSSILSGPMQFIHFSQLLQQFHFSNNEEFANGRTGRYLLHRVRTGKGYAKMQSRLGTYGNRVANKMELHLRESGFQSLYDTKTGNLIGFQFVGPEDYGINTLIDADLDPDTDVVIKSADEFPNAVNSDGKPPGSGRVLSLRDGLGNIRDQFKFRRKFTKALTKVVGLNKLAAANGFRKTAVRGGLDLHPIRRADAVLSEYTTAKLRAFKDKLKETWEERIKNGAKAPDVGDLKNQVDGETTQGSAEADASAKETSADAQTNKPEAEAKAKSKLAKSVGVGTIGVGVLCAARSISNNVDQVKHANIVMPLMRMGTKVISTGAQVATSFGSPDGADIDFDQLGVLNESLYDATKDLGWDSARGIQSELGEELTGPDIPATAKVTRVDESPVVLKIVDSIFDKIGWAGNAACSRIGQFALDAVTGGLISGVVTDVAGSLASAAGVNPLDSFVGWIINTLAGDEVDANAIGPDLGNMANHGARLAANEQAISMGGAKLSAAEVALLDADSKATRLQEFRQKSFFAKMFDLKEPNSVLAKGLLENSRFASLQSTATGSLSSFTSTLTNFGSGFAKLLTPKVKADSQTYDYGFDEYGFSLAEQEDERFDDPYENALKVEPNLKYLTDKYGECFSTKINPDTGKIEGNEVSRYDEIDKLPVNCADRNNEELSRYRFYIADNINLLSVGCFEGDDSACEQIGFTEGQLASASTAPTQTGLESHPNLGPEIAKGYYLLPEAPNGEYVFNPSATPSDRCGSKTLVDVVYTVAKRWYAAHPDHKISVSDLNAAYGHASHKNGVDVDIVTADRSAANISGSSLLSMELGRMFADTGVIKVIFYNDTAVQNDFNTYARSKGLPGEMKYWPGHEDHFHVRILDQFILETSLGCPT